MKLLYTANATSAGGRNGHVESSDGVLNLDLTTPKEMGGSGAAKTNPEQLFAAGYAACFDSALHHTARLEKMTIGSTEVHASVGLGQQDTGKGFGLQVNLQVKIEGLDRGQAEKLIEETHQICPYSNAVRGNVEVTTTLL